MWMTCCINQHQTNKTPLHMAAGEGHAAITTLLLAAGARIEYKDKVS
jgi:ankyrin repeat protein